MNPAWTFTLFLVFAGSIIFGQNTIYHIRHFSVEDGLSSRRVTSIAQDSTGQIWVGTAQGLNSFDGEDFSVWQDTSGFIGNGWVTTISERKDGAFFIGGKFSNKAIFDPYQKNLRPALTSEGYSINDFVPLVSAYSDEVHFLHDENRQLHLNLGGRIQPFREPGNIEIYANYLVTSRQTLIRMSFTHQSFQEIDTAGTLIREISFPQEEKSSVFIFPEGVRNARIHVFSSPDLMRTLERIHSIDSTGQLNPINLNLDSRLEKRSLSDTTGYDRFCIARDRQGKIWVSLQNKLWLFNKNGSLVLDLSDRISEVVGKKWAPDQLLLDQQENVWLATDNGLILVSPRNNPFVNYLNEENNLSVRGIHELTDGKLLVGTYRKLRLIDPVTKSIQSVEAPSSILGLNYGPDGQLYGGTHGPNLIRISATLNTSATGSLKRNLNPIIWDLTIPYLDTVTNTFFSGSSTGLYYKSDTNFTFKIFKPPNAPATFDKKSVNHFHRNKQGLWVGGGGLHLLDLQGNVIDKFSHNGLDFKHFHEDKDGVFWIATSGGGMIRWNPITRQHKQYSLKEGLTSNVLYAVYQDEFGFLWLPSNKGLMRFDPVTETVYSFQPEDGIAHEEFNTYSHYRARDGRLYFGGLNGLTAFYPADISVTSINRPIALTGLAQYVSSEDKVVDKLPGFQQSGLITFAPGDKFFSLTFALQDYASASTEYAWKLLPDDQDWTYQRDNTIRINRLPYGEHQLVIKARGSGGQWTSRRLMLNIFAQPPLHLRLPFQALITIVAGLLVWLFIRRRTNWLLREKKKLGKMVAQRTEELARKNEDLHNANRFRDRLFALIAHDLRAPVISLRGLTRKVRYLVDKKRFDEVDHLVNSVDSAVGSTQNLLDNLLGWAMSQAYDFPYHPEQLDLGQILKSNNELFQTIAEQKNIRLRTTIEAPLIVYADAAAVATILRNLTDNAVKFTPAKGFINIYTTVTTKQVSLSVQDQGSGINSQNVKNLFSLGNPGQGTEGEKGVGLGLSLSKELALANQGDLILERTGPDGSTFTLFLPRSPQLAQEQSGIA